MVCVCVRECVFTLIRQAEMYEARWAAASREHLETSFILASSSR